MIVQGKKRLQTVAEVERYTAQMQKREERNMKL